MSNFDDNDFIPKSRSKKKRKYVLRADAFLRFRELPEETKNALHAKIYEGMSIERIAAWAQDEMQLFQDVKRDRLIKQLYQYRKSPLCAPVKFQTKSLSRLKEKARQLGDSINTLEGITDVIFVQIERVGKLMALEERMGEMGVHPQLSEQLDRLMRYYRQLAELKGELGLLRPGVGEIMPGNTSPEHMGAMVAGTISALQKIHGSDSLARLGNIGKLVQQRLLATVQTDSTAHVIPNSAPIAEPTQIPKNGIAEQSQELPNPNFDLLKPGT